jgi:putative intracellular protease/amidase
MALTRRTLGTAALATVLARGFAPAASAQAPKGTTPAQHAHDNMPVHWYGNEQIAFLVYPRFTALDMVGPHHMLGSLMGATVHIVGKSMEPVLSDMGLAVAPSASFESCPAELDIICVPGGSEGTLAAMQDEATLAFLRDRGSRARLVTSVCTGSLLLGAAGLLRGYRATSHWVARDLLREFGAEPVDARVVVDRNRITGAGVTAGIDFGLSIVARLRDADYAKAVQLLAEYQPEPPFDAGTPQRASPQAVSMLSDMFVSFRSQVQQLAKARP